MKKFNFRLERVRRFRETEKKEKERVLAEKNMIEREATARLDGILEAQDTSRVPQEDLYAMAELSLSGNYQKLLQDALVNQRLLVFEATCAVEEARNAYIEKAIEAEILETLRERRFEEHREERRQEEGKEIDEIAVQRHRFRKSSTSKPTEDDDNG